MNLKSGMKKATPIIAEAKNREDHEHWTEELAETLGLALDFRMGARIFGYPRFLCNEMPNFI